MQTHESYDRKREVAPSSDRAFGLVVAGFLAIVGGYRLWRGHGDAPAWLAAAAVFALLGTFWSAPLRPLNRAWARLGKALHAIVTPVLMGLIFAVAIVPTGLLMRLFGKDPLSLRRDPSATTYWVPREAARPGAMKDQF